ncbi:MAG: hypothetical protein ACXW2U_05670 [Telluria sp.]
MKARLMVLAARIDALSLRERAMVFAAAAAAIVFVAYSVMLGPLFERQKALRTQIDQARNNIGGIDAEITAKVQGFAVDPDAPNRALLARVNGDIAALGAELRAMEQGMVAPERVAALLESILAANGKLSLVSMRTLPVSPVTETSYNPAAATAAAATPGAEPAPAPVTLLYRHGVEITLRGNYLDMVGYMNALEAMPTRMLWGSAVLDVEEYPNSRLTLTLYTMSLDRKWMKL